jgi:hypothetical protein
VVWLTAAKRGRNCESWSTCRITSLVVSRRFSSHLVSPFHSFRITAHSDGPSAPAMSSFPLNMMNVLRCCNHSRLILSLNLRMPHPSDHGDKCYISSNSTSFKFPFYPSSNECENHVDHLHSAAIFHTLERSSPRIIACLLRAYSRRVSPHHPYNGHVQRVSG